MSIQNFSSHQIQDIIEKIYSAALNSNGWVDVVDALSVIVPGTYVSMHGHDLRLNQNLGIVCNGYSNEMMDQFLVYYHDKNPWIPGISASPVGKSMAAELYCPKDKLVKSEFYNDWIRPQEDVGTGGGIVLFRDDERMISISGNHRFCDQDKRQIEWLDLLDFLSPHLRQAFDIQRALQGQQLINKAYKEALDHVTNAIYLLDRKGRICHNNRLTESQLSSGDLFYLDSSRVLHASDTKADMAIAQSLEAIKSNSLDLLHNAIVLRPKNGHQAIFANIVPFHPDHDSTKIFSDFHNANLPIAMLTVVDPAQKTNPAGNTLAVLYRLTKAETELAEALYFGQSLKTYAEARSISIHTARNQLKAIFNKTNTHSQSRLVALIGRLGSV